MKGITRYTHYITSNFYFYMIIIFQMIHVCWVNNLAIKSMQWKSLSLLSVNFSNMCFVLLYLLLTQPNYKLSSNACNKKKRKTKNGLYKFVALCTQYTLRYHQLTHTSYIGVNI